MSQRLEHHNPTQPPMQQVPGIKRHAQQRNQRVIATGHQHQSHQIDRSHGPGPIAHHPRYGMLILPIRHRNHTNHHIHNHDAQNQKRMEATGQGPEIDGARQLQLLVVAVAEKGGVDDVVLEFGKGAVGGQEVALMGVGEGGETTQMGEEAMGELPAVDEGSEEAEDEDGDAGEVVVEHFVEGPGGA